MVLATFCTIGVGIWQGKISQTSANAARDAVQIARDTLTETQHSNTQSRIDSARDSAATDKRAKDALQATIDGFRLDERPYLSIALTGTPTSLSVITEGDHKGQISFGMPVQNFGKTPAVVTGQDLHIAVGADDAKNISLRAPTSHDSYIVDPNDKTPIYLYSRVIDPNVIPGAKVDFPKPVFFYGRIEYTSVFEKRTTPYVLAFCAELESDPAQRKHTNYCNGKSYIR